MQSHINLEMVSDLIKMTQSDFLSIDSDELIRISKIVQTMNIDHINIHCVLKLIANLTKIKFVIDSNNVCFNYDINKLMSIALNVDEQSSESDSENISEYFSEGVSEGISEISPGTSPDSVCTIDSYLHKFVKPKTISDLQPFSTHIEEKNTDLSSDSESNDLSNHLTNHTQSKKKVPDGDIISLVNILCSPKYNMINVAISLINKFSVHKTSSYIPIFKALIDSESYVELKKFYLAFLERNKTIIEHNRKIKEFNHKVRLYNEKIKLMKRKFVEFSAINDELGKIDLKNNSHKSISVTVSAIKDSAFSEICPRNERNLIELPSSIIKDIISYATEYNDVAFVNVLMENISEPSADIISTLNVFFTKENYESIYASVVNGRCMCCNKIVPNNVISDTDRQNIMERISNKILSTTLRHDNGLLISKSERCAIIDKWTEFERLLSGNQFDLIIDGANLGYVNAKGSSDINIRFIQNTIKDIILKTNKKVLLIIHQRHTQKIKQLVLPPNIMANLKIYTTPNNVNDDWFWLYASLFSKAFILTNDQSRDHGCMVAYQNEIKRWIQTYQININMETLVIPDTVYTSKHSVITPGIFFSDSVIHIVMTNSDSAKNCICVHMK